MGAPTVTIVRPARADCINGQPHSRASRFPSRAEIVLQWSLFTPLKAPRERADCIGRITVRIGLTCPCWITRRIGALVKHGGVPRIVARYFSAVGSRYYSGSDYGLLRWRLTHR